jgi:hypothetical protein
VDPRGFPTSLPEFQRAFPNDAACGTYLERLRWPDDFTCPKCQAHGEPYRFGSRPEVLRCRACRSDISLTAGTVMHGCHSPLSTWFWAAYLVTTQTDGMSAKSFQRQLALSRYATSWAILQKLREGMVRPERDAIGAEWPVEVDETLVGGKTRGEGRGRHHKVHVIGAVEVRTRTEDGKSHKRGVYAGRLRLQVTEDRNRATCERFVTDHVAAGATVRTDGWQGYDELPSYGYIHDALALSGDHDLAEGHLPMVHLIFSNFKTWLLGAHHGSVAHHHLQAYCNEFAFRFNRRFYPMTAFHSVLGIAAKTMGPTYAQLYSGTYAHPVGAAAAQLPASFG